MYENITFESILNRMIAAVSSADPTVDTREGSIIYNALAPAAVELANMYIQLDTILKETFADTASRTYLIRRAAERGLEPYPATFAVVKGMFNINVPIGARFSLINTTLNYVVTEQISTGVFKLQCEIIGINGNETGQLIPIDYVAGLTSAYITEILVPADDVEETEHFRTRYLNNLKGEAFGGNIQDYKEKVNALSGIGGVKVIPVWNGGGTVKLIIIASDYTVPTAELITGIQTQVDPVMNSGEGVGIAPIGHSVTVTGVVPFTVNITLELTYQAGWSWGDVQGYFQTMIDNYFTELASGWSDNDSIIVRISQIELRALDIAGIVDVANTTLNGVAKNLTLNADEIPVRGTVGQS